MINKVLTAGEGKSSDSSHGGRGRRERWVQFGAVSSAKLSLQDLTVKDTELDRERTLSLLEEYLSLPVDQYSLLDPTWVKREGNGSTGDSSNSFRLSIPLKDMLGVDLMPELSIEAHPDPSRGQVTLVGSRAILGSPGLDEMFKLNLVAVLGSKRRRRRPGLPDHLPGRPVDRLKQWAAKARGREWGDNAKSSISTASTNGNGTTSSTMDTTASTTINVDEPTLLAPFPNSKVYLSGDKDDMEDGVLNSDLSYTEESETGSGSSSDEDILVYDITTEKEAWETSDEVLESEESSGELEAMNSTEISMNTGSSTDTVSVSKLAESPVLECKVHVTMAVKVPGPLRVVPNTLLGYAGSVITKTVLNAVLPNFLMLLGTDYKDWVAGGRRHKDGGVAGQLFTPVRTGQLGVTNAAPIEVAGGGE